MSKSDAMLAAVELMERWQVATSMGDHGRADGYLVAATNLCDRHGLDTVKHDGRWVAVEA